jgi:hypothetical protein
MTIAAFDFFSDLNLIPGEPFNIADKPTSLFCIVAGNISSDPSKIKETLQHLSRIYKGVFFIDGPAEHGDLRDYDKNINVLNKIIKGYDNVAFLHSNVVVVDSIALVASNGWYGNYTLTDPMEQELANHYRMYDTQYLRNSIQKLQKHVDVKQIVMITSSIPNAELGFHTKDNLPDLVGPSMCLNIDTESKVKTWLYGGYEYGADVTRFGIRYINNPYRRDQPWWPQRVEIPIN